MSPVARQGDPDTSHAAAASVTRLRESQEFVLGALKALGPSTDDRILQYVTWLGYPISQSGCRTRRKELVDLGLVEDTGQRTIKETGRYAAVWRAVP